MSRLQLVKSLATALLIVACRRWVSPFHKPTANEGIEAAIGMFIVAASIIAAKLFNCYRIKHHDQ